MAPNFDIEVDPIHYGAIIGKKRLKRDQTAIVFWERMKENNEGYRYSRA